MRAGLQLPSEEGWHLPAGSDPVLKAAPPGLPNSLLHPYFKRADFAVKEVPLPSLNPQPSTLNPQPSTLNPQPSTLSPQPSTPNPQPTTLNPQPSNLNPQTSNLNPQAIPETRNLKPETRNPRPETPNPEPDRATEVVLPPAFPCEFWVVGVRGLGFRDAWTGNAACMHLSCALVLHFQHKMYLLPRPFTGSPLEVNCSLPPPPPPAVALPAVCGAHS